jgi:dedicator of cytokinesis protein 3
MQRERQNSRAAADRSIDLKVIQYVHQLVNAHVLSGDYTEAGLTLKMHAALYAWRTDLFVEPLALSELVLPRQSQFARKEALLLQTLDYLGEPRAISTAC